MKRASLELAVGVFVLLGIVAVGYLTVKLGRLEILQGDHYELRARFQNVTGLKAGAEVEIAGVPVGRVTEIAVSPEDFAVIVTMQIQKGVVLSEDSIASIKTQGLIGDRFVKISPGGSETELQPGELMLETESSIDFEDLVSRFIMGKV